MPVYAVRPGLPARPIHAQQLRRSPQHVCLLPLRHATCRTRPLHATLVSTHQNGTHAPNSSAEQPRAPTPEQTAPSPATVPSARDAQLSAASSPPPSANPTQQPSAAGAGDASVNPLVSNNTGFQLKPIHLAMFSLIFVGGALFATLTLQFTAGLEFSTAVATVVRRVAKSVAFRQLVVISSAILLLRYGMNNFLMTLSKFSSSPVQWDKTKLFYILREVYQPLELLLFIAAICTVSDAYVPSLIGVPRATVAHVVKSILSTSFILGFASVVFNLKSRFCKENAWQAEMKGDVTTQRRWEAYDKLGTFVIYVMTFVLGIQALGLEVTSVLAIGGIGGLAIGLAGREICENLLNGFLIMSTTPFEVGDEIMFFHNNKTVEGIVIDVGWYRTNVRSFEREVFVIPNAVFSKNIVLNVSRKNREWRFYEMLSIRLQDVPKANAIIQDIRRIVRNDTRVINKLHRRIFLDKITTEDAKIYMSFYLEAANRDAFMAIKQDLLVSFVDCVERNGAKLAMPRTVVDMDPETADVMGNMSSMVQGLSAYAMTQNMSTGQGLPPRVLPMPTPAPTSSPTTTINAEASPINGVGNVNSAAAAPGSPAVVAATPISTTAATSGAATVQPAAAAPVSPTTDTKPQPVMATPVTVTVSGASVNGSPAKPSSNVSTGTATAGAGGQAAQPSTSSSGGGTKVGDVYSAPQSTVVVTVPATGVPIAFAGSVSNNVVTATIPVVPVNGSSSTSRALGSSNNGNAASSTSSQQGGPQPAQPAAGSNTSPGSAAASQQQSGSQQPQPLSHVSQGGGSSQQGGGNGSGQGQSSEGQPGGGGGFLHNVLRTVASIVFENP